MNNVSKFSSSQILSMHRPEQLFKPVEIKAQLLTLRKCWHPDFNNSTNAKDVFHKIETLYKQAKEKITNDAWGAAGSITFETKEGSQYKFKFQKEHSIDTGTMYIGKQRIIFHTKSEYEDLADDAYLLLRKILGGTGKFFEGNKQFLPAYTDEFSTDQGHYLLIPKPPTYILLNDLLNAVNEKINTDQVAWIISSMYNFATYLETQDIVHNEFTEHTYFVDVTIHSGMLLGGWFYSVKKDAPLKALPKYIADLYPSSWLLKKTATSKADSFFIKATGLKLLGDPSKTGMALMRDATIPEPMITFLRQPPGRSVLDDYTYWYDVVLKESYGKPKFRKFTQPYKDIYKGI